MNFAGISDTFADHKKARIVIIPVPFDVGSTWLKGTENGPDAMFSAAENMELYDLETHTSVYKQGIHIDSPVLAENPDELVARVEKRVKKWKQQGKFVVCFGGNHSISIGAVKAHSQVYKQISVLQLDAHADLRDVYEGSANNHACVGARISEFADVVQVGIRSCSSEEMPKLKKMVHVTASEIYSNPAWEQEAINALGEQVYISLDLDVLDPSEFPSTGTPEPGGLTYWQLYHFLKEVNSTKQIIGFDISELLPSPENKAPDFLAAKLLYQLLSLILINHEKKRNSQKYN